MIVSQEKQIEYLYIIRTPVREGGTQYTPHYSENPESIADMESVGYTDVIFNSRCASVLSYYAEIGSFCEQASSCHGKRAQITESQLVGRLCVLLDSIQAGERK